MATRYLPKRKMVPCDLAIYFILIYLNSYCDSTKKKKKKKDKSKFTGWGLRHSYLITCLKDLIAYYFTCVWFEFYEHGKGAKLFLSFILLV